MGKWRVFALRAPSSLIWGGWGFAVLFYFVQDFGSRFPVSVIIDDFYFKISWRVSTSSKARQFVATDEGRYSSETAVLLKNS